MPVIPRKRFTINSKDNLNDRKPPIDYEEESLKNEVLTVKELDIVEMYVLRISDLGYVMDINDKHIGLLHYNEVFKRLEIGDKITGFIKKIKEENKIDVMIGKPGHQRVMDETEKILQLLKENKGFLPFHDKSDPEEIYSKFGMSKKTFKMTIGNLYRLKKISINEKGIAIYVKK